MARSPIIQVRFPVEEKVTIKALAISNHTTMSAIVRALTFRGLAALKIEGAAPDGLIPKL